MALQYQALKDELLAGHPDTGPYNVDDTLAAGELNAINRPVEASASEILQYVILERFRTNTGTDTNNSNLFGRIKMMAEGALGVDVFGATPAVPLTVQDKAAAETFLRLVGPDSGFALSLLDTRFDQILNRLVAGNAIGAVDRTAIQNLSSNKQSRVQEIGFGRPVVNFTHVAYARALP